MIVAYLRVSGAGQIDKDGFRRQLEAVEQYARDAWLKIDHVYQEQITGKAHTDDRPVWADMLCDEPTIILVEGQHRLARDLVAQEVALEACRQKGIKVISAESGADLTENSDPTGVLIRQILGAVAQYDRAMIEAKLRAARKAKKAATGRCEGRKPFGHCDASEQQTLALMRRLRRSGATYRTIAARLNREGHQTREGGLWKHGTVQRILTRVCP